MVLSHFETKTEPQATLFSRPRSVFSKTFALGSVWVEVVCSTQLHPLSWFVVVHGAYISGKNIAIRPRRKVGGVNFRDRSER